MKVLTQVGFSISVAKGTRREDRRRGVSPTPYRDTRLSKDALAKLQNLIRTRGEWGTANFLIVNVTLVRKLARGAGGSRPRVESLEIQLSKL